MVVGGEGGGGRDSGRDSVCGRGGGSCQEECHNGINTVPGNFPGVNVLLTMSMPRGKVILVFSRNLCRQHVQFLYLKCTYSCSQTNTILSGNFISFLYDISHIVIG